jgi:two-component system nitrogen regulation response regulator NtrX
MLGAKPQSSLIEVPGLATMLVVDSDSDLRQLLRRVIEEFQLSLTVCETSAQDLKRWVGPFPDVVLVNLAVSKACLDLLSHMQQLWPNARIILVSAFDGIHFYAEAIQRGAYAFLPRPLETDELGIILQRAVQSAQTKLKS